MRCAGTDLLTGRPEELRAMRKDGGRPEELRAMRRGVGRPGELRAMRRGRAHSTSESFLRNILRRAVAVHIAKPSSRPCFLEMSLSLP